MTIKSPNRPSHSARPSHRRSLAALVVTVMGALLAGACALPVDGEANALDSGEYVELIEGSDSGAADVPAGDEETRSIDLFFVTPESRLIRVRREITNATVNQALAALTDPPLAEELDEYGPMETALTADLALSGLAREEGSQVLSIEVAQDLDELVQSRPDRARLLVSQVVCTITNMAFEPPYTGVRFFDPQGEVLGLLDSNSQSIEGAAEPADFNDCQTAEDLAQSEQEAEDDAESEET